PIQTGATSTISTTTGELITGIVNSSAEAMELTTTARNNSINDNLNAIGSSFKATTAGGAANSITLAGGKTAQGTSVALNTSTLVNGGTSSATGGAGNNVALTSAATRDLTITPGGTFSVANAGSEINFKGTSGTIIFNED